MAADEAAESAENSLQLARPPQSLDEVKDTALGTVLDIWQGFVSYLPLFVIAFVLLILTWALSKVARRVTERVMTRRELRGSLVELMTRVAALVVWLFGLMIVAMILFPSLNPATALGGLGILSIAIGFAFQDIFENFFAGVLLLWRFPFEKGDFIECQDISGKIDDITIRMTKILKTTGDLVVVPNSFLFKNPVNVLTYQPVRRFSIIVGVGYDEDLAQACEIIRKAVEGCEQVHKERPIQVFPKEFGESSMNIEVAWWSGSTPVDLRSSRGEVVLAIKQALDAADIEIPFPYRTLTFKEALPVRQEQTV